MKRIFSIIAMFAIVAAASVSCSNDDQNPSNEIVNGSNLGQNEFYASIKNANNQTRVTADVNFSSWAIDFKWEENDIVTLYEVVSGTLVGNFSVKSIDENGVATFGTDDAAALLYDEVEYAVVYPASTAANLTDRNAEEITAQTVNITAGNSKNNVDYLADVCRMKGTFVMGTDASATLAHESAIMVYNFNTTNDAVPTQVVLEDGSNSYTVAFDSALAQVATGDAYDAYIAIMPNSGSRNISFTPSTAAGAEATFSRATSVEYKAGFYYTAITAKGTFILNSNSINRVNRDANSAQIHTKAGDKANIILDQFAITSAMGSPYPLTLDQVDCVVSGGAVSSFYAENVVSYNATSTSMSTFQVYDVKGTVENGNMTLTALYDMMMSGGVNPTPYQVIYNGPVTESAYVSPSLSLGFADGFFVENTNGKDKIQNVTAEYYKGDNTLVINNFSPSSAMPMASKIVISGLTLSQKGEMEYISGTNLTVNDFNDSEAMFNGSIATTINGELINGKTMFAVTFDFSSVMASFATPYPCEFSGDITINDSTYAKAPSTGDTQGAITSVSRGGSAF